MAKAIETGLPKMRIEEVAARKQARIDSGEEVIVGVNRYELDEEEQMDISEVDNNAVREGQLKRLADVKKKRDQKEVDGALVALTASAK